MATPVEATLLDATCTLLATVPTLGARVFPSRTTPLGESEIPCIVAFCPDGTVTPKGWPPIGAERRQTLKVFVEFDASDDESLGGAAAAAELACWQTLHRDQEWCSLWTSAPSWVSNTGRDATSNRRRCTIEITINGTLYFDCDDPLGLVALHEIRGNMTDPDGADEHYAGPSYQGRVPVNPEA